MQKNGFTLVEILICLAIFAILAGIAAPNISQWQERSRIKSASNLLYKQLAFARQQAIATQKPIIICASVDGVSCSKSKNWTGLQRIIFYDENRNFKLDMQDEIFLKNKILNKKIELHWRAFGNKAYIRWLPSGLTHYQNGSFTFCPSNKKPELIQQIILNANGRAYFAKDKNHDGIIDNSQGDNIQC